MKYSHIALSASAGSGKTFMLSVRFIALILDGAKLSDIVALTFTKKAVGEMKERIERVFCDLANYPSELAELAKLLEISQEEVLARKDKRLKEFLSAELRIYTFDSFFSKILRLFASYMGLRPDFELKESKDLSECFLKSLNSKQASVINELLCEFNISLASFLESLDVIYSNYTGNFIEPKECAKPDLMSIFKTHEAVLRNSKDSKINKWCDDIVDENSFLDSSLFSTKTPLKIAQTNLDFAASYEALNQAIAQFYEAKESKLLKICFEFARSYAKAALKEHRSSNELSFNDVAIYVHKILKDAALKELLYFRLNSDLKHLLIDEFQDTSIIQYEIIRPIVEEITAGLGLDDAPKSFFYVGDKKQSIYSFRGANQAVFDLFINEPKFQISKQALEVNYRSYKEIVDFNNEIFSSSAYGDEFIKAKAAKPSGGSVNCFEIAQIDEAYEIVLNAINQLEGKICILVRKNKEAAQLAEFLRLNDIEVTSGAAKPLYKDLGVRVLLEFAKYCVFGDEAYGYFIASVLGHCPKKLELDLFKAGKETFMYLAKYLNLSLNENLLSFIASCEDEFLDNLYEESQALSSEQNNQRVVIMTIHKSKGLQFDNVICLHLHSKAMPETGLRLQYDFNKSAWDGHLISKKAIRELRASYDEVYKAKVTAKEKASVDDELNTIYVAYTRAIKNLIIIKDEKYKLPIELPFYNDANSFKSTNKLAQLNKCSKELAQYDFSAYVPLQNKSKSISSEQIELGLAFHYFCELSDYEIASLDECLELVHQRYLSVDKKALFNLASKICACNEFKDLIANKCLVKELGLYVGSIKRIDLIAYDENSICIIDYKSGADSSKYIEQLNSYEAALKACEFAKSVELNSEVAIYKYLLLFKDDEFYLKLIK